MKGSQSSTVMAKDGNHSPETSLSLADLPLYAVARVVRIDSDKASQVYSYGIHPGVEIELRQRRPSYVVRCEETELAMEASLAEDIWVEAPDYRLNCRRTSLEKL